MADISTRTFSESATAGSSYEGGVIVRKSASDDGAGNLAGVQYGAVNYDSGLLTFTPTDAIQRNTWSSSEGGAGQSNGAESSSSASAWSQSSFTDTWGNGSVVRVRYAKATATPDARQDAMQAQPLLLNLTPRTAETIVPGSVGFWFAGWYYFDRADGLLWTGLNPATGAATVAGVINYRTGMATVGWWNAGHDTQAGTLLRVATLLTAYGEWTATRAFFCTAGSPLRPASLYVQATATDGTLITGTADASGNIAGALVRGAVQQDMGVVRLEFGSLVSAAGQEGQPWFDPDAVAGGLIWRPVEVVPSTIRYNAVVLSNLPLNADVLGIDPVRLPTDGRVPCFRPADVVVLHSTRTTPLAGPAVAGATYSAGRGGLSDLWVLDAQGAPVGAQHYVADLEAGTITMAADLDLGATPQPLRIRHRVEELNLASDVQINGQISLTSPLARGYDAADSWLSSALLIGDLQARVTNLFDQATWTGVWSNALQGAQASAQFNDIDFPVEVANEGALSERWRIHFTSATVFQVIGESLGVIATGHTGADLQPMNALTGKAYFTLRAAGWGSGWSAGNQLRFNTVSASVPIWIARTVLPGATLSGDSLDLQVRGDVDA